jgi:hypothetical protein
LYRLDVGKLNFTKNKFSCLVFRIHHGNKYFTKNKFLTSIFPARLQHDFPKNQFIAGTILICVCGGGRNRRGNTALKNLLLMNFPFVQHHGVFSSTMK